MSLGKGSGLSFPNEKIGNDLPLTGGKRQHMQPYDPDEQLHILAVFAELLALPTADGGRKRAAGTKVNWQVDRGHWEAFWRHLRRYENGETYDAESQAHALIHAGWRLLACAAQDMHRGEPGWLP